MAMIVSLHENVWLMSGKKVCVTCDIKCCIEGQVWRACFMSSLVSVLDSLRQFLQYGESSSPIWCSWLLNKVFPIFNLERISLASLLWYRDIKFLRVCWTKLLVIVLSLSFDFQLEGEWRSLGVDCLCRIALYFPEPFLILSISEFMSGWVFFF